MVSPVLDDHGRTRQVVAVVWDASSGRRIQQKIDAIDAAGRELVRLEAESISKQNVAQRLKLLEEKVEFVKMDEATLIEFAKTTNAYLESLKKKHPDVKAALDSQDEFKKDFAKWRSIRSGVAPYPYEQYIQGVMGMDPELK
jgi:TRAP-type mannitol/chloroaromatic compound transport system substrate-binding protein